MKLGLRVLLGFFVINGIAAFIGLRLFVAEVRPSVRHVMEDLMVDTANILAELVRDELARMPSAGTLEASSFAQRVPEYASRPVDAKIWGLSKRTLDYRVYVTDATGRVVFDSGFRGSASASGADYSQWRDVALTLSGRYGARATREIRSDESTSVMYVAAPVRGAADVIGVLTVAKPMSTVQQFVARAEREILVRGAWLLGVSAAVGVLVTGWLVWSVRRLRRYAQGVQLGQRIAAPRLSGELGELASAMQDMRERLEGREHVEGLVRALTHELKSPLTAIAGAAELLRDDLPATDREAFSEQIQTQSVRLRQLVERLLELSKLEHRRQLERSARVDLVACAHAAQAAASARAMQRAVAIDAKVLGAPCVLTFIAVGLVEAMKRLRVHPIQYLLVGSALVVFFLLLVSLSEHWPFGASYAAAAAASTALLSYYGVHVLRGVAPGLAFGSGIAMLFGALYVLLQLEQGSLVLGAVLLFLVLAAVMGVTRKLDWYALLERLRADKSVASRAATTTAGVAA